MCHTTKLAATATKGCPGPSVLREVPLAHLKDRVRQRDCRDALHEVWQNAPESWGAGGTRRRGTFLGAQSQWGEVHGHRKPAKQRGGANADRPSRSHDTRMTPRPRKAVEAPESHSPI
jgi:hypothetical protein